MTKLEFMKELESLLLDVPLEEREEALGYYNGYFEDAGEDREEEIIKELGSPNRVAAIIKADLNSNAADRESRGYFTENGYQDTIYNDTKYELVGAAKAKASQEEPSGAASNGGNSNYTNGTTNANTNGAKQGAGYQQGAAGYNKQYNQSMKNNNNTGLIILIAILSFPIWLPIVASVFGILIGVIATVFGLIVGLGAAGIGLIIGGVALFVVGLMELSVPFLGFLLIGSGLIVFGLGMLFSLACGALCKTVLPAIVKGFVNLCRLPFKNRSVMA